MTGTVAEHLAYAAFQPVSLLGAVEKALIPGNDQPETGQCRALLNGNAWQHQR